MKKILIITAFIFSSNIIIYAQNNQYRSLMKAYDVKHYNLDLQINNSTPDVSGNVIITSEVLSSKLDTFVVELVTNTLAIDYSYMIVDSVKVNNILGSFKHENDLVIIPTKIAIPKDELFSVQVFYHGLASAFDFNNFTDGTVLNNNGIRIVTSQKQSFSMSESRGAKLWWPCKQDLEDKADSLTFYITTDSINKSGSNGILKSIENLPNGKIKYKWETKYPISYYLIAFAVGPFDEYVAYAPLQNHGDSVLIQSLLRKNSPYFNNNISAIETTKQLIGIYSELLGDYPFMNEKYGYCAVDTTVDGMENQTITTINASLFDSGTSDSQVFGKAKTWLIAHELAHSWFGNSVTCKTWNDIWINEGFASYMEYVALQKMQMDSVAKDWLNTAHNIASSYTSSSIYVTDAELNEDSRIFSYGLSYKKGASIIHTLRYEINNDSLFFRGLKDFLNIYAYSVADAIDFKNVMESVSGLDLTDFFNQWYYGSGYPSFKIDWHQNNDTLTIISNQTNIKDNNSFFRTHFDIKLLFTSSDTTIRLFQDKSCETYRIPIKNRVFAIELDPENWILKNYHKTTAVNNINAVNTVKVYPNPFLNKLTFKYSLDKPQEVRIDILNTNGILVNKEIVSGYEGDNIFDIDIMLDSGIYMYRITIDENVQTGKLIKL